MNSVKPKIYIYSGKVHSGKTTNILEWTKTKKSIDGILAPVIDSKRYLYRIKSKEYHLLEADEKEDKNKRLDPYSFFILSERISEAMRAFE